MDCLDVASLKPGEFLTWWLNMGKVHGLDDDYRELYSNYFLEPGKLPYVWKHYEKQFEYLLEFSGSGKEVLDVGCGLGTELMWLGLNGANVTGIEMHARSLDIANKRLRILKDLGCNLNCKIEMKSLFDMPATEKYDVIFLRQAFHHIEPRLDAVKKLSELLKPSGKLIIEETNGWNPVLQAYFYKVRGLNTVAVKTNEETGEKYLFGNERITTGGNITRLFKKYGVIGESYYYRILPTSLANNYRLVAIVEFIEKKFPNNVLLRPSYLHYRWVGKKG